MRLKKKKFQMIMIITDFLCSFSLPFVGEGAGCPFMIPCRFEFKERKNYAALKSREVHTRHSSRGWIPHRFAIRIYREDFVSIYLDFTL